MPVRRLVALAATFLLLAVTSSAVAGPRRADPYSPEAIERRAIELKGETPDWYTPQLHRKVVAAGKRGESVPLPKDASVDSALLFTGIRPGSWMITPAWCTMNFVFGTEGSYSIGTAGHCTSPGDEVVIVAAPGVLMSIGTTTFSVDNGIGDDFALIDISDEMQEFVNPSMAVIAGPTGAQTPAIGDPILHVGHGLVVGTGGTPRAGVVTYVGDGDGGEAYGWDGAANLGDSGSGVRAATGNAVGNLTHLVVGTEYVPAFIAGTTIDRIQGYAGSVATASLVPDPLW